MNKKKMKERMAEALALEAMIPPPDMTLNPGMVVVPQPSAALSDIEGAGPPQIDVPVMDESNFMGEFNVGVPTPPKKKRKSSDR